MVCNVCNVMYFNNSNILKKIELDIAELQLNMDGKKTLRQRKEQLQSTVSRPARPFKTKKKNKYKGVNTNDINDDDENALLSVEFNNASDDSHDRLD